MFFISCNDSFVNYLFCKSSVKLWTASSKNYITSTHFGIHSAGIPQANLNKLQRIQHLVFNNLHQCRNSYLTVIGQQFPYWNMVKKSNRIRTMEKYYYRIHEVVDGSAYDIQYTIFSKHVSFHWKRVEFKRRSLENYKAHWKSRDPNKLHWEI